MKEPTNRIEANHISRLAMSHSASLGAHIQLSDFVHASGGSRPIA